MVGDDDIETLSADLVSSLVLSVPHGGTRVPEWCRQHLAVSVEELWSDWRTAELYAPVGRLPAAVVRTRLSRFVADPNRSLVAPLHGDFWKTAVPASFPVHNSTSTRAIYSRALSEDDIQRRLETAHHPYHRALDRVIATGLEAYGRVLLLDLHSFGMDLGADIVLGDANSTTANAATVDRVEAALAREGFNVVRNRRFSGGHIVRRFGGDPRVDAIQVELNQRCYLNRADVDAGGPTPPRDEPKRWDETQTAITAALASLT